MPKPERGRIIWAELNDPQGKNRKRRPAVILTATDEIKPGEPIVVVGVSTQFDQSSPEVQVRLPWGRPMHRATRLNQECAAVCTWLEEIYEPDILEYAGIVPGDCLLEILKKVDWLA